VKTKKEGLTRPDPERDGDFRHTGPAVQAYTKAVGRISDVDVLEPARPEDTATRQHWGDRR